MGSTPSDAKRRAIKRVEQLAEQAGITLPEETKRALIERMDRRLASAGLGWDAEFKGAVVRTDERGVARLLPQAEGLSRSPDGRKLYGGKDPASFEEPVRLIVPPGPKATRLSAREAAQSMHKRLVEAIEKHGMIPSELMVELRRTGWDLGQPVPRQKVEEFAKELTRRVRARLAHQGQVQSY